MSPVEPPEPPSLFARMRAGERVVDDLVAENLQRLHAFVRAHMPTELRGRETDGDLLQSICVELIGSRQQFDFRGEAQFRAWMFTAAFDPESPRHRIQTRCSRAARVPQNSPIVA